MHESLSYFLAVFPQDSLREPGLTQTHYVVKVDLELVGFLFVLPDHLTSPPSQSRVRDGHATQAGTEVQLQCSSWNYWRNVLHYFIAYIK